MMVYFCDIKLATAEYFKFFLHIINIGGPTEISIRLYVNIIMQKYLATKRHTNWRREYFRQDFLMFSKALQGYGTAEKK